jgi:hypothetical protein
MAGTFSTAGVISRCSSLADYLPCSCRECPVGGGLSWGRQSLHDDAGLESGHRALQELVAQHKWERVLPLEWRVRERDGDGDGLPLSLVLLSLLGTPAPARLCPPLPAPWYFSGGLTAHVYETFVQWTRLRCNGNLQRAVQMAVRIRGYMLWLRS